jgi:hypothetical protein
VLLEHKTRRIVDMTEVKAFKIEKKFKGVTKLYEYLFKNIQVIEQATDLKIQKNLMVGPFCIIGKEEITERQILIFASEQEFPESLGELIVCAAGYNTDIVIFLLKKVNKNYLLPMNWLKKICTNDYEILVGQVNF